MDIENKDPEMRAIDALETIGRMIIGTNGPYQTLVYKTIKETGKAIEELTVKELLAIDKHCNEHFNKNYRKLMA